MGGSISSFIFNKYIQSDYSGDETVFSYDIDISQLRPYKLQQKLGEGSYGVVYQANDKYALKFIPLKVNKEEYGTTMSLTEFNKESKISDQLSNLQLAPHFIDSFIVSAKCFCRDFIRKSEFLISVGIIVQERWDCNLENYRTLFPKLFQNDKRRIRQLVKHQIRKLVAAKITHADTDTKNVVVNIDGRTKKIKEIRFIDFSIAKTQDYRSSRIRTMEMLNSFAGLK
jgi:serine/threonine protein kinase